MNGKRPRILIVDDDANAAGVEPRGQSGGAALGTPHVVVADSAGENQGTIMRLWLPVPVTLAESVRITSEAA